MPHGISLLVALLIVLAIVVAVLKVLLPSLRDKGLSYPYEKEGPLFSPAERSFLGVLEQAVNGQVRIMGKVRLADVVKTRAGLTRGDRQRAFNRIQSKHLDFVACDPKSYSIQFIIELDDKSHRQGSRQERDDLIDGILEAAGLQIFHFAAKRSYSVEDIRNTLFESSLGGQGPKLQSLSNSPRERQSGLQR